MECPKCRKEARKYGTVKRIVRTKYRESEWVTIQRWQCKDCNYIWRELPDEIMPFKQYEREMIEGVREGLIDSDILGFEDYPSSMTMRRWRTQK